MIKNIERGQKTLEKSYEQIKKIVKVLGCKMKLVERKPQEIAIDR